MGSPKRKKRLDKRLKTLLILALGILSLRGLLSLDYINGNKERSVINSINLESARSQAQLLPGAIEKAKVWEHSEELFQQGILEMEEKNYAPAKDLFLKVVSLSPENEIAYNNLGYVYLELKDYSGAISAFNKVIGLNPLQNISMFGLALAYYKQKNLKRAVNEMRVYIRNTDDDTRMKSSWPHLLAWEKELKQSINLVNNNQKFSKGEDKDEKTY